MTRALPTHLARLALVPGMAMTLAVSACSAGSAAASDPSVASGKPAATSSTTGSSPTPSSTARSSTTPSSAGQLSVSTPLAPDPGAGGSTAAAGTGDGGATADPAQQSRNGPTQRHTFAPSTLRIVGAGSSGSGAGGSSAASAAVHVDAVDTTPDGELTLPKDPGRVGWWQSGALAGEAFGSVVLAGHIDSHAYGLGVFARLLQVRAGDQVILGDGHWEQRYTVVSHRNIAKASLATGTDTFSQSVPARLVLITCTGRFNAATHHYEDNLVVVAEPHGPVSAVHR